MPSAAHSVEVGGRVYTARQLTLGEMIDVLRTPPAHIKGVEEFDVLLLADEGMTLTDLLTLTDATLDDLKAMSGDDLSALAAKCKAVNTHFFQMRRKLDQMGQAALQETGSEQRTG